MATTNNNFKVKNGLDAVSEISTLGNLYANKTTYGFSVSSAAPASITYWKIATLPTTSAATLDHIVVDAILDDNWSSSNKVNAKVLFSNRDAFTYRYYLDGTVRSAARIVAYTEADGSVSIYLRAGTSTYCSMSYNITHGIDNGTIIYKNPAATTTTPTGTSVFDSSNIATYVPERYTPYTGQPIIRGLVTSAGVVSGASFVKTSGTSSQFLKADGSSDSSTYLATATSSSTYGNSYFAGHHPEGRIMYNAYLTNDMANARLRGSTLSATQNGSAYTISNANWDAMFDGTASFFNISPTSGFTFPLVLTISLPRTLTYGTWVGIGFGASTWRAASVQIEVFSLDSNSWVTVVNTTSNISEDVFSAVSGLTNANANGISQIRYTLSAPNSTQLRIAHLWAYNFNSDMWSQTMMPRAGGTIYGSISAPGITLPSTTSPIILNTSAGTSGDVLISGGIGTTPSWLTSTGSGNNVRATSPTFATSVIGSTSMDVFNTVSTAVNAFGAATTMNIGTAANAVTIGNSGSLPTGSSTVALFTGSSTTGTSQTINLGTGTFSTASQTINIGTGASTGSATRAINIGTSALSTGTTTTTINGTLVASLGKKVIQTATLSGTSAISFTSIPSTYRDLEIRILATTAVSTSGTLTLTVNSLTTNIYNTVHQYVNGVSPSSITYAQQSGATSANLTASTFGATASSALTYTLRDYTSGSFKVGDITWMGGPSSGTYFHGTGALFVKTTAAITQIDIAVGGTGGITGTAVLIGVY